MERWERDGCIETERRERHIRDEFKEEQCQTEVLAGRMEEVADVADTVEETSGQMDQLQRMVQQVIDNGKPALLLLRQLRPSTDQVGARASGRSTSWSWATTSRCGEN